MRCVVVDKSKSKLGAFTVVVALVASLVTVLGATRADALSPGVDFGAGDLSTWQTNGVVWAVGESQGRSSPAATSPSSGPRTAVSAPRSARPAWPSSTPSRAHPTRAR